jgi:hypothetical protein
MNSESVQVTVPAERYHGSAALEEAVRLKTVIFDKGKTWLPDDLFPTFLNMSSGGRRFFLKWPERTRGITVPCWGVLFGCGQMRGLT